MSAPQQDKQKRKRSDDQMVEHHTHKKFPEAGGHSAPAASASSRGEYADVSTVASPSGSSPAVQLPIGVYPSPGSNPGPYPGLRLANQEAQAGVHCGETVDPDASELDDAHRYPSRTPSDKAGYLYLADDGSVQYAPSMGPTGVPEAAGQAVFPVFTIVDLHYCAAPDCATSVGPFTSLQDVWEHQRCHRQAQQEVAASAQTVIQSPAATSEPVVRPPAPVVAAPTPERSGAPSATATSPASASSPEHVSTTRDNFNAMRLARDFPLRRYELVRNGVLVAEYYCDVDSCKEGNKAFPSESPLRKHQRSHIPPEQCPYPCGIVGCDMRFLSEAHRNTHRDSTHGLVRYYCLESGCGWSTSRYDNLVGNDRHWMKRHPGTQKPTKAATERRVAPGHLLPAPVATPAAQTMASSPHTSAARPRHTSEAATTTSPVPAVKPPSRSRAPSTQSSTGPRLFDMKNIHPELRHFQEFPPLPSASGVHSARKPSSSQRADASAPTPARHAPEPSPRHSSVSSQPSSSAHSPFDGFSKSSHQSPPSTAPTSVSSSSNTARSYSQVAAEASKRHAESPTPVRHGKRSTQGHDSNKSSTSSRNKSPSGSSSSGSSILAFRLKPTKYQDGGFGSHPRS